MDSSEHVHSSFVQYPSPSEGESVYSSPLLHPAALSDMAAGASPLQALARGIITLADPRAPMPLLVAALRPLLLGVRLDILLAAPGPEPLRVWLTTGSVELAAPPASALASEPAFIRWLTIQGYSSIEHLPLITSGPPIGCLVLSRATGPLDQCSSTLAASLAEAFVLRYASGSIEAELHATSQALRAAEERLALLERVRRQATLAAGSVHDLNNLLTVLLNYTELLRMDAPAALQPDLRAMDHALQDGMVLVRRVLTEDSMALWPSPVTDVSQVVEETIALTRSLWEREQHVAVAADLAPDVMARIDPVHIRQVLINLIRNAVAAMPEGGVLTLRSQALPEQALVEVSDTGTGIAREYQAAIFEPLQTTRAGGCGLGLAVSRQIVEQVGGQLTVVSAPGRGATFTITLPAAHYHH
jgi:signal transduction histidine kinase